MSASRDGAVRRRYLLHLLAAVASLGLYMPVWLARRDEEVKERVAIPTGFSSAWALGAGTALGLISRAFLGGSSPNTATVVSLVAAVVFLSGTYQVARNLEKGLDRLDVETPAPPLAVTGGLGLVFAGIELGNRVDAGFVRVPVLLLVLGLPYAFWRLHIGFEIVKAARPPTDETTS